MNHEPSSPYEEEAIAKARNIVDRYEQKAKQMPQLGPGQFSMHSMEIEQDLFRLSFEFIGLFNSVDGQTQRAIVDVVRKSRLDLTHKARFYPMITQEDLFEPNE